MEPFEITLIYPDGYRRVAKLVTIKNKLPPPPIEPTKEWRLVTDGDRVVEFGPADRPRACRVNYAGVCENCKEGCPFRPNTFHD